MRKDIHPKWYPNATVTCSCGHTWTVGSTKPALQTDICSHCHPFYTGEQRIVDTEGQVDRFMKRLEARDTIAAEAAVTARGSLDMPLTELGLGRQFTGVLAENGIATAGDFINRLREGGDEALLDIQGIGRRVLTDFKKRLRARGYELPTVQA
jgi:large subunit ribosomal protein L31